MKYRNHEYKQQIHSEFNNFLPEIRKKILDKMSIIKCKCRASP